MAYGAGQNAANAINKYNGAGGQLGEQAPHMAAPPQTIASALSRIDGVNERLSNIKDHLSALADQIGGPRGIGEQGKVNPAPVGAVGRLNDSANRAHDYLSDIEGLLADISRALG